MPTTPAARPLAVTGRPRAWTLALVLPAALSVWLGVTAAGDVDGLAAKGVKFKKEKGGTITEVSFGSDVTMTADDYRAIGRIRTLKKARMGAKDLPLDDETAPLVGGLDGLEFFFANGARVSDEGMKAFAGMKGLKHFGFDHWSGPPGTKGYVGAGLAHLAALPDLESVRFGGCRVDNAACAALAKVKTLQSVDLFHTFAVTDDGIPALQSLPRLRAVRLAPQYTPRITDKSLEHLAAIPTLEEIRIGETWLTYDGGFAHLKKLPKLRRVELAGVIAAAADVARLRADHPAAEIEWAQPDEETAAKTKERFRGHFEKLQQK